VRCPACGAENRADARFCDSCGAALGTESSEHRKVVTVLFCDVVGSTALGEETDPEALRALLARYFERMKTIIERHGGSVEKFIGDAVMAVFGVPAVHEDDALRALRAAAEMRDAFSQLGIEGRIGVNTGEVVAGTEERLATGDAVNIAARLEQAAQPGEVLVGRPTLALVGDAVEVEPVEPLKLKGKAEPVPAFRLLRVRDAAERPHEARFVGRERELAIVWEAWERVQAEQRCELVTVAGDAGVGKSRLLAEALASIDATVVRGRCLPYGEGITYWPVVEVLKQLDVLPADETAAVAIRSLLGETDAATSAEEIAWAFRKSLEQAAAERPLAVVFDDIHSGEETFLDLIEHVALLSSGASILLLCIARPELTEHRPSWPVTLRLEPLGDEDVDELLPERIAGELREKITRAAGGNPLFIREMLAMAGESEGEVIVPPTLQALLAARLDQLQTAERRVLERGAVEGEIFHRGAVQALAPEESQVTPRLAALVRKELIRPDKPQLPGEDGFRFRHLLIRDAAYDALPKATRAELHERFAFWLEEHGAELVELDEILGYHLEQACRYRAELGVPRDDELAQRAHGRLAAAGLRADERNDVNAAAGLLRRALALLPPDEPATTLRLRLAAAIGHTEGSAAATACLVGGAELAGAAGDRAGELRLRLAELSREALSLNADEQSSRQVAEEALALFETAVDELGQALAWELLAVLEHSPMRSGAKLKAAERMLEHAQSARARWLEVAAIRQILTGHFWGPTPLPEVERIFQQHAETARRFPTLMARHASAVGMLGRLEEGRALMESARVRAQELGGWNLGWGQQTWDLERYGGDLEAAERALRLEVSGGEATGELGIISTTACNLAGALYAQGKFAEAEWWTRRGRELGDDNDAMTQIGWRQVQAKLHARRGEQADAERLAREAVGRADATDDLMTQADARLDLAEVLELGGGREEAVAEVERALELFDRKGHVIGAARARERLAELQAVAP
jgi:class 3 adenylate cyclase/tetratricopeptide (TPR) repeat protein